MEHYAPGKKASKSQEECSPAQHLKNDHTENIVGNSYIFLTQPKKKLEMAKLILLTSQEGLHDSVGNGDTEASCLKPDPLEEARTFLKEWDC